MFDRYLNSVSGGDGSLLPRAQLDWEARRFLACALDPNTISLAYPGRSVLAPIRVYAGLDSAPTAVARVELAVDELERLGGLERSTIVVCSPTGRGYVNLTALEALEALHLGDAATIAVQYGNKRSIRSRDVLPLAVEQQRLLLHALRQRLDQLDPDRRPELVVYAESLGAWASQAAIAGHDIDDATMRSLLPDRGAWVGAPHGSRRARARLQVALERLAPGSTCDVARSADAPAPRPEQPTRFVFLAHRDDPVVNFNGAQLAYRPPPARTGPDRRWLPIVTFARTLLEINSSTKPAPGDFRSSAHDYRAEIARTLRLCLGYHRVTDTELATLEQMLLRIEERRAPRVLALGPEPIRLSYHKANA